MLQARRLIEAGSCDDPFAVVAAQQTGGIGRHGRVWHSPPGGLWMTHAAQVRHPLAPLIGLSAGLCVLEQCRHLLARFDKAAADRLRIKWPNDIVHGSGIDAAKIAGLLIQTSAIGGQTWLFCGIGINVYNSTDAVVDRSAVSLRQLCADAGAQIDHETIRQLSADICAALGSLCSPGEASITEAEIIRRVTDNLWGVGLVTPMTLPDGTRLFGRIDGLDHQGNLLTTIDGTQRTLRSIDQMG